MIPVLAMLALASWADPGRDLTLTVGLRLEPLREACEQARRWRPHANQWVWLVLDTEGRLSWFGVSLETGKGAVDWPEGQGLEVTLKDGRRLRAERVVALLEGEGRLPVELGLVPRRLPLSRLYHQRSTVTGRVGAVLMIALPDPRLRRADIAALHLTGGVP